MKLGCVELQRTMSGRSGWKKVLCMGKTLELSSCRVKGGAGGRIWQEFQREKARVYM